jgi:hypothetical protein
MKLHALLGCLVLVAGSAQAQPEPDEPAHGWIATPAFTAPAKYQKFTLTPGLVVQLQATIPKVSTGYTVPPPFDFVAYAKASPFTEKWHIDLVREGPGGSKIALKSFAGLITSDHYSITLTADWFRQAGGPGTFAATSYLSQITPNGTETGLATGVGFTITAPPVSLADQNKGHLTAMTPQTLPLPPGVGGSKSNGPYDIELYRITVKPGTSGSLAYQEGEMVSVGCDYSVLRQSTSATWPPISWNRYITVDGQTIWQQPDMIAPPPNLKSSKGFGWTWTAKGAGPHKIRCGLGNPAVVDQNPANNQAEQSVLVTAFSKTQKPASANQKAVPLAVPVPRAVAPSRLPVRRTR